MPLKKINITYIFMIFGCLLIFGCKKNPFDYRTKFLGDYSFNIHNSSYDPITGSHDTAYASKGKIWYGSDKHTVLISFSGGGSSEFTIYEDGTLDGGGCRGEFESTKKVEYHCGYYSPASHSDSYITGEKN